MEELRSTDILDKEIIADAHKKAERIAERTEAECRAISEGVVKRVEDEISKTRAHLAQKLADLERDMNASVPLEKERFFVSFVQDSIVKNINEYLENLGEEKRLQLVLSPCKKFDFGERKVTAYVYGFNLAKAKKALSEILGKSLDSVKETSFNKVIYEESFLDKNEGIIIISEDEDIKCRFTLCEVMAEMADKYRIEMAESLFGEGVGK